MFIIAVIPTKEGSVRHKYFYWVDSSCVGMTETYRPGKGTTGKLSLPDSLTDCTAKK